MYNNNIYKNTYLYLYYWYTFLQYFQYLIWIVLIDLLFLSAKNVFLLNYAYSLYIFVGHENKLSVLTQI